jgi:hypothetical protein
MGYIEEAAKVKGTHFLFTLLFVAGAICPGLLTIWNFEPSMISDCSSFMVILLSIAMTFPVIAINTVIIILAMDEKTAESDFSLATHLSVAVSCTISILTFGIPLFISFIGGFCLQTFFWSVAGAEVLAIPASILAGKSTTSRDKSDGKAK